MRLQLVLICVFSVFINIIKTEVVNVSKCEDSDDSICEIKQVRVNPCKEAKSTSKKPCKFKSGTNATIEFDYIINFESNKLINQAYWASFVDLPLVGMDRDACKFTECPTKTGQEAIYKNSLFMSPAFPLLNYDVKWRLWDAVNDKKGCCFIFKIKLAK